MTNFHKSTIQQRIIAIIAACFVVMSIVIGFNFMKLRTLSDLQNEGGKRSDEALAAAELTGIGARLNVVAANTEIDLKFAESRQAWAAVKAEAAAGLAGGDKLADEPSEQAHMRDARAAYDRLVAVYEGQLLPALESKKAITPEIVKLDDEIGQQADAMTAAVTALLASLKVDNVAGDKAFDATAADARLWALLIAGSGLLVLFVATTFMVRDTSRTMRSMVTDLRSGAQQVAAASTQVASSAQQLSQGSTEQAASLEETSASMEEMASMTRKNAENSQTAASRIADTDRLVGTANAVLAELVISMKGIRESSSKVTKIIKTIDEIAFQTNILALNAAVEAARAGEAGMGFAVVADEVRNLAQRSAKAAQDTAALIEESASSADAGGVKVDGVVEAMTAITQSSVAVKRLIDEVSVASQQQAQGIDQVTQAINQMEKVTQTTAATAEESAAASEELNAQAEQSMDVVARLEALVGAGGSVPPPVRKPKAAARRETPAKVVRMATAPTRSKRAETAEDVLPLEDTGTFGRF